MKSLISKIIKNKFKIYVKVGSKVSYYYSKSNSKSHIQNLLAALTIISIFFNLKDIRKDIFLDFKLPEGRGDFSKLRFKKWIVAI